MAERLLERVLQDFELRHAPLRFRGVFQADNDSFYDLDYALYFFNLRSNVAARISAFCGNSA